MAILLRYFCNIFWGKRASAGTKQIETTLFGAKTEIFCAKTQEFTGNNPKLAYFAPAPRGFLIYILFFNKKYIISPSLSPTSAFSVFFYSQYFGPRIKKLEKSILKSRKYSLGQCPNASFQTKRFLALPLVKVHSNVQIQLQCFPQRFATIRESQSPVVHMATCWVSFFN